MKSIYFFSLLLLSFTLSGMEKIIPSEKLKILSENGVILKDQTLNYTDYQYSLLASFDFNAYRNYSTNRLLLIEDGPVIEILSLLEMQKAGKIIPAEYFEKKKNEVPASNLKSIITKVNIGFRYGPKKNTETGF